MLQSVAFDLRDVFEQAENAMCQIFADALSLSIAGHAKPNFRTF